jgi:hypothetical protein
MLVQNYMLACQNDRAPVLGMTNVVVHLLKINQNVAILFWHGGCLEQGGICKRQKRQNK